MKIALFPNLQKYRTQKISLGIREFLTSHDVEVYVEDEEAEELGASPLSSVDPGEIDYLITLGGDGTIIRLVHRHPHLKAPILGVNLGGLGFMADIPDGDIYQYLQHLLEGKSYSQKHMILDGEAWKDRSCIAVNDLVVHRAKNPTLIDLSIHVDGKYLNTFSADGMIVATPCGSTAYSLAAGGPILTPDVQAVVLTPICPHTISNRPLVVFPEKEIKIQYISELDPVEVAFDGMSNFDLHTGETLTIRISDRTFELAHLPGHDYFTTLRTKLAWTGTLRS